MAYKRISPIPVVEGGTGAQTLTIHGVLLGQTANPITALANGTTGQILTAVTGSDPTWAAPATQNITITGDSGGALSGQAFTFTGGTTGLTFAGAVSTETLGGTLAVKNGGTGNTTFTAFSLITAGTTATGAFQNVSGTGTTGQLLVATTGGLPVWTNASSASSITITGDTGGALTSSSFTFTGGTTGLSFGGSGSTETLTFAGITANGGTVSLATDATTSTINIGTGAGIKTSTFGSTNSTSATTVQSGTGALNITSTGGALTINSGTGALGISTDASATTVSIATGGAVKDVTLGSQNSTSSTTIDSGTGAINIGTAIAKTITIGNVTGATAVNVNTGTGGTTYTTTNGIFTLATGTGAITISDDATNTTLKFGTGAGAKLITIGSTNGASSITERVGTGNFSLDGAAGSTYTIGASTTTGTITIGGTAQTGAFSIGNTSGTMALTIGGSGAGTVAINSSATGASTFGNLTGTTTINFGGGSALTDYKTGTFTPTLDGSTPGVTTYTAQVGQYIKIGNLVWVSGNVTITAATGTGSVRLGGYPYTINNTSGSNPRGECVWSGAGWTWPAGTTMLSLTGITNTTNSGVTGTGSATASASLQMTNAAAVVAFSLVYTI